MGVDLRSESVNKFPECSNGKWYPLEYACDLQFADNRVGWQTIYSSKRFL